MTRTPTAPVVRRVVAAAALALLVAGLGAGCSTASQVSPPQGVDELTVPTPSPDPDDFVERIDNPWLPLVPGSHWSYEVLGGPGGGIEVDVADETATVAGVEATVVETTPTLRAGQDGTGWSASPTTDYYAQDTRGNVWWLGRAGEWQVGQDGAEAGIAMLATPRRGDGYRGGLLAGVEERIAEVRSLEGEVDTTADSFQDLVVIDVADPSVDSVRRGFYARGTGLVLEETTAGLSDGTYRLLSFDAP